MNSPYDNFDYQKYWIGRDYDFWSERRALIQLLEATRMGSTDYLLDAGAGYGRNASLYARVYRGACLLDPSSKEIETAKKLLSEYGNLDYKVGGIEKLPFEDKTFDCILCVRVLHHLNDPLVALLEFRRTLKIGGFLILEVANKMNLKTRILALFRGQIGQIEADQPIDKRSLESKSISTIPFVNHNPRFIKNLLLKNGFEIKEILSVSNFRSPFSRIGLLAPAFLFFDRLFYRLLAKIWFGPSIIFLARKQVDKVEVVY